MSPWNTLKYALLSSLPFSQQYLVGHQGHGHPKKHNIAAKILQYPTTMGILIDLVNTHTLHFAEEGWCQHTLVSRLL
jgi:hypothetical protein